MEGVKVATPLESSVAVPVIGVLLEPFASAIVKVTVPDGTVVCPLEVPQEPEPEALETSAVKEMLEPATRGLPEVVTTVRVEVAFTVSGTAVDVAVAVVAPEAKYSAVMESVPTGKLFVTNLAMSLVERATEPNSVVPSKNSTVPPVAPLTVAAIKTDWPN